MASETLLRVAIVDDDDQARFLLQKVLEQFGDYSCIGSYASGEEAVAGIPSVNPQIVLMDIKLPRMSGIECMRRLKGILPGLTVVLVSGITDPDIMAKALAEG